jgi:hypothetical protein
MKSLDADAVRRWKKSQDVVNRLVLVEARAKTPRQRLSELDGHLRLRAMLAIPSQAKDEISFSLAWSTAKEKMSGRV